METYTTTPSALDDLIADGRIVWSDNMRGWVGVPGPVIDAFRQAGWEAYKFEIVRGGPQREPTGGLWQGLEPVTGRVASVIWKSRRGSGVALLFAEIDGTPIEGGPALRRR